MPPELPIAPVLLWPDIEIFGCRSDDVLALLSRDRESTMLGRPIKQDVRLECLEFYWLNSYKHLKAIGRKLPFVLQEGVQLERRVLARSLLLDAEGLDIEYPDSATEFAAFDRALHEDGR